MGFENPFGFGLASIKAGSEVIAAYKDKAENEAIWKKRSELRAAGYTEAQIDEMEPNLADRKAASEAKESLASNTFVATAKDAVAVKDAYQIGGSSVITSVKDLSERAKTAISDAARGGKWVQSQIPALTSLYRQGQAIASTKSVTARLVAASKLTNQLLAKVPAGTMGKIMDYMPDVSGVTATIGGVSRQISAEVLSEARALGALINGVTDDAMFAIKDAGSMVGFISAVMQECVALGLPDVVSVMMGILDEDTHAQTQVTAKTLPQIIASSDLSGLRHMAETSGDKVLLEYQPTLLADFSSVFRLPNQISDATPTATVLNGVVSVSTGGVNAEAVFGDLRTTYRAVDSEWDTVVRVTDNGPRRTLNLTSLIGGTSDLQKTIKQGVALSTDPQERLYLCAAGLTQTTVSDSIKRAFPSLVTSDGTTSANATTDPSLLTSANLSMAA